MTPVPETLSPAWSGAGRTPGDHAADVVNRSRSSFTFGMRILARPRREAMFAIYAFARTIDDIADGEFAPADKLRLLGLWREELDRLADGDPLSLIGRALAEPVRRYQLPLDEFALMIEGMVMDAGGPVAVDDLPGLLAYTRRVAGTVGILSIRVFGAADGPVRDRFALDLADAFQLTNILRDVEEDARLGRLYLPRALLDRHKVAAGPPAEVAADPRIGAVCREIGLLARERFAAARAALPQLEAGRLRPALMMMGVYEGYLDKLEAAEWRRTVIPLTMSRREKLWRGLRQAYLADVS